MDLAARGKINRPRLNGRRVQREQKAMRLPCMILMRLRGRVGGIGSSTISPRMLPRLPAGAGDPTGKLLPPGAIQGRTDYGTHAFGGACPPKGDKPHRYIFTVYALKIRKIDVPSDSSAALIGFMIHRQLPWESKLYGHLRPLTDSLDQPAQAQDLSCFGWDRLSRGPLPRLLRAMVSMRTPLFSALSPLGR